YIVDQKSADDSSRVRGKELCAGLACQHPAPSRAWSILVASLLFLRLVHYEVAKFLVRPQQSIRKDPLWRLRFGLHDNSGSALQADVENMRDAERLEALALRRQVQNEVDEAIGSEKNLVGCRGHARVNDCPVEPAGPFRSTLLSVGRQ